MIGHAAFDATGSKMLIKIGDCNSRLLVKNWGYVNYFRYIQYNLTSWFVDKKKYHIYYLTPITGQWIVWSALVTASYLHIC